MKPHLNDVTGMVAETTGQKSRSHLTPIPTPTPTPTLNPFPNPITSRWYCDQLGTDCTSMEHSRIDVTGKVAESTRRRQEQYLENLSAADRMSDQEVVALARKAQVGAPLPPNPFPKSKPEVHETLLA